MKFYINYVVYKLATPLLASYLLCSCFILTMWYINYKVLADLDIKEVSFILTMWYINKDFAGVNNTTLERFILTMWYINNVET